MSHDGDHVMRRAGLIGRSILASKSPLLHEGEARAIGRELSYELFDFTARGWSDAMLGDVVRGLTDQGYAGVNVTFPFKQAIMPLLDDLDDSATTVEAVNTVAMQDGRLIGHNTDMTGFVDSVERGLPDAVMNAVVQFGAGGAGSAVANALLSLGASRITIADVNQHRASDLCDRLCQRWGDGRASVVNDAAAAVADADGIVNASPMGMAENPGSPVPAEWLSARQWVADIVYFPLSTQLLDDARRTGCRTLNGSGMVIAQAARAFEIMTGWTADQQRMRLAFDGASAVG